MEASMKKHMHTLAHVTPTRMDTSGLGSSCALESMLWFVDFVSCVSERSLLIRLARWRSRGNSKLERGVISSESSLRLINRL